GAMNINGYAFKAEPNPNPNPARAGTLTHIAGSVHEHRPIIIPSQLNSLANPPMNSNPIGFANSTEISESNGVCSSSAVVPSVPLLYGNAALGAVLSHLLKQALNSFKLRSPSMGKVLDMVKMPALSNPFNGVSLPSGASLFKEFGPVGAEAGLLWKTKRKGFGYKVQVKKGFFTGRTTYRRKNTFFGGWKYSKNNFFSGKKKRDRWGRIKYY
ncbi:MAG: hypothetical protein P8176_03670, partial [Gammaproteobacteria bacterium]